MLKIVKIMPVLGLVLWSLTCSSSSDSTAETTTAPTVSYSGSPFTYYTNTTISSLTPTLGGSTPTSCSASPTLPAGLSIAGTTCVISGAPTATQGATSYTITATNSAGSGTAAISITVATAVTPTVSYTGSPYSYVVGSTVSLTATLGGTAPATCTSSPTLPTGLAISATTCAISGTVSGTQGATTHTITATNGAGSGNTTISITSTSASTTSATIAPTTATLDGGTGCITNVNTTMDSALPAWIKNNFKCQIAYVSGTNYVFKSVNLPNHASYYYCGSHPNGGTTCTTGQNTTLWAALPGANYAAGTNVISTQNLVYTIPITPTVKTGTLQGTQAGYASIGITTNGIAIFNNAAAAPDVLADEANTFDAFGGHPQNTGLFHHHAAVTKVSATMNTAALIGIAADGYAIYDEACDLGLGGGVFTPTANTNAATGNATTDGAGSSNTVLDRLHGHTTTTQHFSTATYHYHYMLDTTATIRSLMGSYFKGTPGSVSN